MSDVRCVYWYVCSLVLVEEWRMLIEETAGRRGMAMKSLLRRSKRKGERTERVMLMSLRS